MICWEQHIPNHYFGYFIDGICFHLGESKGHWTLIIPGPFHRKPHDTEMVKDFEAGVKLAEELSKKYVPMKPLKRDGARTLRESVTGKKGERFY